LELQTKTKMDVFNDEKIIRRISRADVKQLQVLYRIIFGTDGAPKWMKKHILQLEGCELANDSDEFGMMLERALNADEEDLEFTSWLLGLKTNCSMDELSGNVCRFLCSSPNAEQDKISLTNSRVTIQKSSFKTVSVAASTKKDDLKSLRLRLEKEEELLRMKQQENEHRMRILELQWRVREAEDDILQNESETVKNWLHNDSDSICEDVRSKKSDAVGERQQQERVPEKSDEC
jgi:hypothetical protein